MIRGEARRLTHGGVVVLLPEFKMTGVAGWVEGEKKERLVGAKCRWGGRGEASVYPNFNPLG